MAGRWLPTRPTAPQSGSSPPTSCWSIETTRPPLGRLDDPAPHARLLSNGRYTVLLTGAGSGFSRWDGLALTAWSADRTDDADGFFLYVRDPERGIFWSLGHQPVQRPAARYRVRYRPGVVTIARLDE